MYPLDWTGNHFIDPALIRGHLREASESEWNPTRRNDRNSFSLREAVASQFGTAPPWVHVVPGSAAGIDAFLRSRPDAPIIDIVPNFHQASIVARRDRRRYFGVQFCPGDDLRVMLSPFRKLGAVLVLASPSNPFGHLLPLNVLEDIVSSWHGAVLIDEAYADFAYATALPLLARHSNLVISRTFSKAWGLADLRIGFLAGQSLNNEFDEKFLDCMRVSRDAALVAARMMEKPLPVHESVEQTRQARDTMVSMLDTFSDLRVLPSDANYLTVYCTRTAAMEKRLEESGLRAKRLSTLRHWPREWPDGFRIAVCPPPIHDKLMKAFANWSAGK